jgi:hypothetical protein
MSGGIPAPGIWFSRDGRIFNVLVGTIDSRRLVCSLQQACLNCRGKVKRYQIGIQWAERVWLGMGLILLAVWGGAWTYRMTYSRAGNEGFEMSQARRSDASSMVSSSNPPVEKIQIVSPEDVSALSRTRVPSLALVTCFPFYQRCRKPELFSTLRFAMGRIQLP